MEKLEIIKKDLREVLSEDRYNHSIGVMEKAEELAKIYGVDPEIAALTGLTHDIAKEIPNEDKLKYVKENNIKIDEVEKINVGLLHAKIGADIVKKKYNFTEDMQNAIKYHTTAHPDMDLLAKIIFVSDKVEKNRSYALVEEFRNIAEQDIDKCILEMLNYVIKKNIDKGVLIHPDSVYARNELLLKTSY